MALCLRPITLKAAREYVRQNHRHHPNTVGGLFALAAERDGGLVGVVIVGRPVARGLCDGATAEVTRCCTDGSRNVCSFLYGAARRAAQALGYRKLVTYTLEEEIGTSLAASGFERKALTKGGQWGCPSRPRRDGALACRKVRWERELTA